MFLVITLSSNYTPYLSMGDSNGKQLEIDKSSKPPISALKLLKNKPTTMKYSWKTKKITPEFIVEESKKSIVKIVHQFYKPPIQTL
jgi:hypothetical protein